MTHDIFEDEKFLYVGNIILPNDLLTQSNESAQNLFIIVDIHFFNTNEQQIREWLLTNCIGIHNIQGAVICFELESDALLFKMVWC